MPRGYQFKYRAQAVAMYQSGMTLREVGEKLGTPLATIQLAVKASGAKCRPANITKKVEDRRLRVICLAAAGLQQIQIADILKTHRNVIYTDEKAIGIPFRNTKAFALWQERMRYFLAEKISYPFLPTATTDATSPHAGTVLPVDVSSLNSPRSQQGAAFFARGDDR